MSVIQILVAVAIGLGATLLIDIWALLLRRAFDIRGLNYCMLGRWVLHMPNGTIKHANIAGAAAKPFECHVGWTTHYLIGAMFAVTFVYLAPNGWLTSPTILPALAFGITTVLVPFLTLQPALGLGIASSKTARPNQARIKSLMTHTVFGLGLWLAARLLSAFT